MSDTTTDKLPPQTALRVARFATSQAELWLREHAEAIAERRVWIEANGTPLADIQVMQDL